MQKMTGFLLKTCQKCRFAATLAGVAGFEPTNDGVRARGCIKNSAKIRYFKYYFYSIRKLHASPRFLSLL